MVLDLDKKSAIVILVMNGNVVIAEKMYIQDIKDGSDLSEEADKWILEQIKDALDSPLSYEKFCDEFGEFPYLFNSSEYSELSEHSIEIIHINSLVEEK